jgi:hypothetical protein
VSTVGRNSPRGSAASFRSPDEVRDAVYLHRRWPSRGTPVEVNRVPGQRRRLGEVQ